MKLFYFYQLFSLSFYFGFSINFDTNSPYAKSVVERKQNLFGFSVNIFNESSANKYQILVGAPLGEMPIKNFERTGALYSCPVGDLYSDCHQVSVNEGSSDSLFGYSVESSTSDGHIYTCAPRFLTNYVNIKYVSGKCWELDRNLKVMETIINDDCRSRIQKTPQTAELRNCLTGAALLPLGDRRVLVAAPYSHEGRGEILRSEYISLYNARGNSYFGLEKDVGTYQLTGSSIATGRIFSGTVNNGLVMGGPSMAQKNVHASNVGLGLVAFARLQDGKTATTFAGLLWGPLFGDGFGYSVSLVDLDGDGWDDLVVGAPFSNRSIGAVYVYWSSPSQPETVSGFHLPIEKRPLLLQSPVDAGSRRSGTSGSTDVSRQFGVAIEPIGDVNKDGLLDIAVGAPMENDRSGVVYIYHGSRTRLITMVQRIEALSISPLIRGFGFSLYGRGLDIDTNGYPDLAVGAPLSSQLFVLRGRPIIRLSAADILSPPTYPVPYRLLDSLDACNLKGRSLPCLDIRVSIFYQNLKQNPSNSGPSHPINWTLILDEAHWLSTGNKRIFLEDNSHLLRERSFAAWKNAAPTVNPNEKKIKIYFSDSVFFNASTPIVISLRYAAIPPDVKKRDFAANAPHFDLNPVSDKPIYTTINKIVFGAGCGPDTCKPILQMMTFPSLKKVADEYILYITTFSNFSISVHVTNIASESGNEAHYNFIKVDFNNQYIEVVRAKPGNTQKSRNGLTYIVKSPLKAKETEISIFEFNLLKDFLQSGNQYIYVNMSLSTTTPQQFLKTKVLKIRMKMVANINIAVSVKPESNSFQDGSILGFKALTSEEKIGPNIRMSISLSNKEQASVVVASKLVVYFPWEIATGPGVQLNESRHGQYMLYLLRQPRFLISTGTVSGGKRNISCDLAALSRLVNVINTRIHTISNSDSRFRPVVKANVTMPTTGPKMAALTNKLVFVQSRKKTKTDWEKTVLISCRNGTGRCVPMVFDLGPLSRQSGEITIQLDFRIWMYTLIENYLPYQSVQIDVPIYWIPDVSYDIVLNSTEGSYVDARIVAINLQKPKPPPSVHFWYAIAISAGVGAVLLCIIVVILYKCRFFQRKNFVRNRKVPK